MGDVFRYPGEGEGEGEGEGGASSSNNGLLGMCRWMGSHFHDWINYNGVVFSIQLLECCGTFSGFWA